MSEVEKIAADLRQQAKRDVAAFAALPPHVQRSLHRQARHLQEQANVR
jgi:hypothetical protein